MSAELTKHSKNGLKWGNASDIQMKRTTQLRHENVYYSRIDSDVLQRNIARLDAAFKDSGKTVEAFEIRQMRHVQKL
jgi:putative transposase